MPKLILKSKELFLYVTTLIIVCFLFPNYSMAQVAIGYWNFDSDTENVAIDNSGKGNNGIITGPKATAGIINNALKFNGLNDRVEINNSPSLELSGGVTLALWMYASDLSKDWVTLMHRSNAQFAWFDWQFYARAKDAKTPYHPVFRINWNNSNTLLEDGEVDGDSILIPGKWYFLACTYNDNQMKFFMNGRLCGLTKKPGGQIPNGGRDIWIGGNDKWGEYFKGVIDEVYMFNYALDQKEIQNLMSSNPDKFKLNINLIGNGQIIKTPAKDLYSLNEVVQVIVKEDSGWVFSDWEGDVDSQTNPLNIRIDGDKTITAKLEPSSPTSVLNAKNNFYGYKLYQNYPNPFNPTTQIKFSIPHDGHVILKVYDITGKEVYELLNGQMRMGIYELNLNLNKLASGTYFCRIIAGDFIDTKKIILLK